MANRLGSAKSTVSSQMKAAAAHGQAVALGSDTASNKKRKVIARQRVTYVSQGCLIMLPQASDKSEEDELLEDLNQVERSAVSRNPTDARQHK